MTVIDVYNGSMARSSSIDRGKSQAHSRRKQLDPMYNGAAGCIMPRSMIYLLVCAAASAADMTVVIEFDGPHSERSVEQMKRETADIFKEAGLRLDWRGRE